MDNQTKKEEGFPYNLWMEIFGDMPEEPLVQDQVDGIFAALDTLTPREKDAILYCYRDGMTLEQAGRKFNISRERLRQIVAKGCRKLQHQSRRWLIEYGAEGWKAQSTYAKRKAEIDREMAEMDAEFGAFVADLQLKREKLSELERSLDAKSEALAILEAEVAKRGDAIREVQVGALVLKLDDLDFSVRTHNCLWRAGVETVSDILNLGTDGLMHVRNLGKKSLKEIVDKMATLGFEL